jgi:hypothetical protein
MTQAPDELRYDLALALLGRLEHLELIGRQVLLDCRLNDLPKSIRLDGV